MIFFSENITKCLALYHIKNLGEVITILADLTKFYLDYYLLTLSKVLFNLSNNDNLDENKL